MVSVCFSRFYPQFLSRASESRQAFLTIEDSLGLQFLSLFVFRWIWYLDKMIFLKLLHFFNLLNFLHAYRVKHCREPAKVREIKAVLFASSALKSQNWKKRKFFFEMAEFKGLTVVRWHPGSEPAVKRLDEILMKSYVCIWWVSCWFQIADQDFTTPSCLYQWLVTFVSNEKLGSSNAVRELFKTCCTSSCTLHGLPKS